MKIFVKTIILICIVVLVIPWEARAVVIPRKVRKDNVGNNQQNITAEPKENQEVDEQKPHGNSEDVKSPVTGKDDLQNNKNRLETAFDSLISLANRNGDIAQQLRSIAVSQKQNAELMDELMIEIKKRGKFAKFFIGPKYREIKEMRSLLEKNGAEIKSLYELRTKMSSEDALELTEQIKVLQQHNAEIEEALRECEKGFSLFGWLIRLLIG